MIDECSRLPRKHFRPLLSSFLRSLLASETQTFPNPTRKNKLKKKKRAKRKITESISRSRNALNLGISYLSTLDFKNALRSTASGESLRLIGMEKMPSASSTRRTTVSMRSVVRRREKEEDRLLGKIR